MKKEQAMAAAMKRLKQAAQQQLESRSSFTATFIVTVFVQHKDGDSCNLQVRTYTHTYVRTCVCVCVCV